MLLSPRSVHDRYCAHIITHQLSDVVTGLGKSLQQYPNTLETCPEAGSLLWGWLGVCQNTAMNDPSFFRLRGNIVQSVEINFPWFFFFFFSFFLLFWFPGTLVSRSLKDLLHRRKTFVVPRNLAKILNEAAEKSHGDQVTLKDIPSKYPSQFLPATGTTPITVFCAL